METRDLTCIVCPRGCELRITLRDGVFQSVRGNACPRGAHYAETECTHPERTVTSTVRCAQGAPLPVRTAMPVPKERVMDVMHALALVCAPAHVEIGTVIVPDVCGTGVDVIATERRI